MTKFAVLKNIQPQPELVRENIKKDPGFGLYFTDHMAHVRYTLDDGWHAHQVQPYAPLQLDPAAAVFHYAQEIFEGLKAYRHADGSVWTFRPDRNAARINKSAERLALPQLPEEDFIESLKALVTLDQQWVPTPESEADESSLYLRPFMIATERFLGVRSSHEVDYYVISCPAGPTSPAASSPSRSGCRRTSTVQVPAAPDSPSAAETTPAHWPRRTKPQLRGVSRCCSPTLQRASTSTSSAA